MYRSTKTYGHDVGLSCAFRQWRARDSHCRFVHGYALSVALVFEADYLDDRNWVVDFGALKEVKSWLIAMFDHKLVVAKDDPLRGEFEELNTIGVADVRIVDAVGCEAFAQEIAGMVDRVLMIKVAPRVRLVSVEVREHGANSAIYFPEVKK